ncbi:DUF5316 family protein [Indiicoccus explosivorum]|uniref:DUF5316 family protein n=1 Tax=Indiicoccus explosivorum TaxID=1917864 RepID=UPI000B4412FE|nr:DUF5316 family protein [Indiicoccus explosivorum]
MKSFLIGSATALAVLLIAYLADNWSLAWMIAGAIAILAVLREAVVMGRRDSSAKTTSSEKRREQREQLTKMRNALLFAVPHFIVALIALLLLE